MKPWKEWQLRVLALLLLVLIFVSIEAWAHTGSFWFYLAFVVALGFNNVVREKVGRAEERGQ